MDNFFSELKRRNVVRVGIAYAVVAWVILQFVDIIQDPLNLPDWFQTVTIVFLGIGFPVALIVSWAFEVTPEGVMKTAEVDKSKSVTHGTGQKINKLIIGGLVLAVGFLLVDKFYSTTEQAIEVIPEAEIAQASIAVLPFSDLSVTGDQEYFADGLSEEILNVLVGVDDLTVASRTSSFQFKDGALGVPDIAAKLGVTYVLEGSVRKAGKTIRITGQLIEAETDRHLWSDTFDRELTTENLFAIQDEIASAIVEALRLELGMSGESMAFNSVEIATENLSAYETFLKGRKIFHGRRLPSDISTSITLFEAAVAEDPNFALGWQWLGAAYSVAKGWGLHREIPREYSQLARQASDRALDLNPNLAFAYAVRGFSTIIEPGGDYLFAMEQLERGLELAPNDVTMVHWYGIALREMGFVEAALDYFKRCEQLDPAFSNCREHTARNFVYVGDYVEALDEWNRNSSETITLPPFTVYRGFALAKAGQTYAARLILSEAFKSLPSFPVSSWVSVLQGKSKRNSSEGKRVEKWLDNWSIEQRNKSDIVDQDVHIFIYLSLGAFEKAPTTNLSPGPGNFKGIWLKENAGFRKTEQFKEIVSNMNFLPYWQARGFPPGCRAVGDDDFECDMKEGP